MKFYLISACRSEIVKDRKKQVNSDWCRKSIRYIDDNKLSPELVIFVGHAEQRNRRHETRHQREGNGENLKAQRRLIKVGYACLLSGFTHSHAAICQQKFIGSLLLVHETNIPKMTNGRKQCQSTNTSRGLQSNANAYQQRDSENQTVQNTKHCGLS